VPGSFYCSVKHSLKQTQVAMKKEMVGNQSYQWVKIFCGAGNLRKQLELETQVE